LRVDATASLREIEVPTFALRASHDRVIGARAYDYVATQTSAYTEIRVPGPHALLQAAPAACAMRTIEYGCGVGLVA
jgi:hypothetical protein